MALISRMKLKNDIASDIRGFRESITTLLSSRFNF